VNIQYDTNKWLAKVAPYIGQTRIINELYDDYALMSRIEIGGYSMTYYTKLLNEHFFNVDEVFDADGRSPVV
jgi:hypothetical protein